MAAPIGVMKGYLGVDFDLPKEPYGITLVRPPKKGVDFRYN